MPPTLSRRKFLQAGAALAAGASLTLPDNVFATETWDAGDVVHLLPTANHERLFLKASFRNALRQAPRLQVGHRHVTGHRSDTDGRFWQ